MSGPEFGTFPAQLCLQQLVFVLECLVCQQELVVQLIPLGNARLKEHVLVLLVKIRAE